jgi:hypothetical protein
MIIILIFIVLFGYFIFNLKGFNFLLGSCESFNLKQCGQYYNKQPITLTNDYLNYNLNLHNVCTKSCESIASHKKKEKQLLDELTNKKKEYDKLITEQKKLNMEIKLKNEDNLRNINKLYDLDENSCGDDKLANKMKHMSLKNKQAIINRAKWNKSSFIPFIEEELNNHSNSIWWDNQDYENQF